MSYRIAAIVGHGRRQDGTHDPGAVGGGWDEQRAGHLAVRAMVARLRRAAGVTVPVDESDDRDDPNYPESTAAANAANVDLVVSAHCDWIKAPTGAFGLYTSTAGRRLSDAIEAAIAQAGFAVRDYRGNPRDDLYLLNRTRAPAVIIEMGRIGEAAIDTPEELAAMGRAMADGVLDYLDVPRPAGDPPGPTQVEVPVALITQHPRDKSAAIVAAHVASVSHLDRDPVTARTIGPHRVEHAVLVGAAARDPDLEQALRTWHGTRRVTRITDSDRHRQYARLAAWARQRTET